MSTAFAIANSWIIHFRENQDRLNKSRSAFQRRSVGSGNPNLVRSSASICKVSSRGSRTSISSWTNGGEQVVVVGFFAEVRHDFCCYAVNVAHHTDLLLLLHNIALVYAYCIGPKEYRLVGQTEPPESKLEIFCHQKSFAIDGDEPVLISIPPCVQQSMKVLFPFLLDGK
jgi:hypothetical protein